jgi:flavin-dependent dehydrogenase
MNTTAIDVLVVGGGPAGLAVALGLRRQGELSVAVVEKSEYDAPRVGETLSPGARPLLEALGVWDAFAAADHLPAYGTAAAWGSPELAGRDFLMTPFGTGWNLDRRAFDALLADTAVAQGVELRRDTHVTGCEFEGEGWRVAVEGAEPRTFRARFLVDATGRSARFARRLGAELHFLDHQVAIVGTLALSADTTVESATVVEAFEGGWCYSVRVPGPALVVALLTDGDLARGQGLADTARWLDTLSALPHTGKRLAAGRLAGPLRTVAAHSARLDRPSGPGWIAVGDAAASHDPLSGSGIVRALDSGLRAARAVHEQLARGRSEALADYDDYLTVAFERYAETRAAYFQREARWPEAPYWSRRQPRLTLDPRKPLVAVPDAKLPTRPADLLGVDVGFLLARAREERPAHELVTEHRERGPVGDLPVVLALQWMVEVGALRAG